MQVKPWLGEPPGEKQRLAAAAAVRHFGELVLQRDGAVLGHSSGRTPAAVRESPIQRSPINTGLPA
jgi:hypothetical protein